VAKFEGSFLGSETSLPVILYEMP